VEHSDTFYINFARILKVAEDLKIFVLPSAPNKFSQRNLKRLDSLDTEVLPLPPSSSPLYSVNTNSHKLRLVAKSTKKQNVMKTITLSTVTEEELLKMAGNKLGMKVKTATTQQGERVDDVVLQTLKNDTVLLFS